MVVSYFILSTEDHSRRLLSYAGAIKGGKIVLTLKVEITDNLSYVLEQLEEIQRQGVAKPKKQAVAPRLSRKTALLALPAPSREA